LTDDFFNIILNGYRGYIALTIGTMKHAARHDLCTIDPS
jgi:hypothetical protein